MREGTGVNKNSTQTKHIHEEKKKGKDRITDAPSTVGNHARHKEHVKDPDNQTKNKCHGMTDRHAYFFSVGCTPFLGN